MLLSRPILTPTYCSVFIVTVAFLLITWSITLFAGGRDGGKKLHAIWSIQSVKQLSKPARISVTWS